MEGRSTIKTILVMVILILVGVLVVFGLNTVKTYMSGAAVGYEPKGVSAKSNDDGKSAVISWTTEKPVMTIVEYGITPASLLLRAVESSQETSHNVTLNSLKPNVSYYYRIRIREKDNEDTIYDNNGIPYQFKTKADGTAMPVIKPEETPGGVPTSTERKDEVQACNRTTDYNSDGAINSKDFMECMRKNPSKALPTTINGAPVATGTATPRPLTSGSPTPGCDKKVDYDKNGIVNTADWFRCLQGSN